MTLQKAIMKQINKGTDGWANTSWIQQPLVHNQTELACLQNIVTHNRNKCVGMHVRFKWRISVSMQAKSEIIYAFYIPQKTKELEVLLQFKWVVSELLLQRIVPKVHQTDTGIHTGRQMIRHSTSSVPFWYMVCMHVPVPNHSS